MKNRRLLALTVRIVVLLWLPAIAAAWVYAPVRPSYDWVTGAYGSVYYAFYDFNDGWYSMPVIVAFLVLFAVTGIVLPRPPQQR